MKKVVTLFVACIALPALMADVGSAATKSQKQYCHNKARKYADEKAFGNTVGGAIGGAVLGGIVGGLVTGGKGSGVGTGAAIGAGVGGVGGAANSSAKWDKYYWKKYDSCISKYY